MSFARIMSIAGRIISQFRRDHRTLGLLFIAPILVMTIFGYVFRAQEDDTIKVAIVNEDRPAAGQTSLAAPIVDSLKSNDRFMLTDMSREEATNAVRDGSQKVAIVFGPDFTTSFANDHKGTIEVI